MFLSSKVWSEWPSQGVFTIVYNVRIKFLYWISYWFTKYNIFFLIWHFVFWFCCLLFLLAFASLYFFRYMVLRMLFFEFQYSIYIYIYIYIYIFSFKFLLWILYFFIAQSRSKFFVFCHENIYSLLWFVIEIQTTFLMIFFSGAKGSSLYKSCNTSEWEDQLLRNILLIDYQDNYLDKNLLD